METETKCRCSPKVPKGEWREKARMNWILTHYVGPALSGFGAIGKLAQVCVCVRACVRVCTYV